MVSSFEQQEDQIFQQEVAKVKEWFKVSLAVPVLTASPASQGNSLTHPRVRLQSPRFNGLVRPYTAEQVVAKRGTIELSYPSNTQAKKLHALLKQKASKGEVSHTYGA